MKVAFLGKGGSGKSTLATHAVQYLRSEGRRVLAIDADHNMDLSYALGSDATGPFLGTMPGRIKEYIGVSAESSYAAALEYGRSHGVAFRLDPVDPFTDSISVPLADDLRLVAAGPHTDAVRYGGDCSHSLAAPLKAYLPLLALAPDEAAVIDERAGTDPVATGILTGIDRAVIVVEPTVQSVRVGCQIAGELQLAGVPHVFAANKTRADDDAIYDPLPHSPLVRVPFSHDQTAIREAMKILLGTP